MIVVDDSGIRFGIVVFTRSLSDVDASTMEVRIDSFVFETDFRISLDALSIVPFALFDICSAASVARRNALSFARLAIWDAEVEADDANEENRLVILDVAFLDSAVVTVADGDVAVPSADEDDVDALVLDVNDLLPLLVRNSKNATRSPPFRGLGSCRCIFVGGADSLLCR